VKNIFSYERKISLERLAPAGFYYRASKEHFFANDFQKKADREVLVLQTLVSFLGLISSTFSDQLLRRYFCAKKF
jgi:hypothetical protein